jgi:hypothetical protein
MGTSGEPAARNRQRFTVDATAVLTVYLALLVLIPSTLTFRPLGTIGAPATLLALVMFIWWLWEQFRGLDVGRGQPQPVRRALLAFLLVSVLVYAHAHTMPMAFDEMTPSDTGLPRLCAMAGLALVAMDGVSTVGRWRSLLNRLAVTGSVLAVLGLVQFVAGRPLVDVISLPGLSVKPELDYGMQFRSGFLRPSGTGINPIEYGAVLAMLLPIALVNALTEERRRILRWAGVGAMLLVIVLSLSRTAMICALVAVLTLLPMWTWRTRATVLGVGTVGVGAAFALFPGVLAGLQTIFLGASNDPSIASRTNAYRVAFHFIEQNPWLGRGYGTFLPKYWTLDNLYLQYTIESGIASRPTVKGRCQLRPVSRQERPRCSSSTASRSLRAPTSSSSCWVAPALPSGSCGQEASKETARVTDRVIRVGERSRPRGS